MPKLTLNMEEANHAYHNIKAILRTNDEENEKIVNLIGLINSILHNRQIDMEEPTKQEKQLGKNLKAGFRRVDGG